MSRPPWRPSEGPLHAVALLLTLVSCRGQGNSSVDDRAPSATHAPTMEEAEDLIRGLYQPYLEGRGGPPLGQTGALTTSFQAVLETTARAADGGSQPDPLDFDPVVGSSDWDVHDLSLTSTRQGRHASVVATFQNLGQPQTVTWDLSVEGQTWRIDDIHLGDRDLRQLLRDLRSAAPASAPELAAPSDPEAPPPPPDGSPQDP